MAAFSSAPRLALFATSVRCLNSSSWRIGSNWSSSEGWNFDHCRSARTFFCSALAPYLKKKSRSLFFCSSLRLLRHTSGSPGISGDFQITLSCLAFSGWVNSRRSMPSVLKVATSTCLLATASALTSWLELRVRLKALTGSTLFLANT